MSGHGRTGTESISRKWEPVHARRLHLTNTEGRKLSVTLRGYRPGDEEGMIACIRDEYGETYFKRNFYQPDFLKKEAESGHITFLVAETGEDGIAGMLILKEFAPQESMCEIASQIFRKKYRGYGLAMPFFEYGMEILLSRDYSAAYCLPVVFHDTTQRLLYRLGMRATGFVLNVFDMAKTTHSYHNGRNSKHSQGIQIKAAGKRNAGVLYIPREHQMLCKKIYEELGVDFCIEEENGIQRAAIPPVTVLSYKQEEQHGSMEICISRIGLDLPERMEELHRRYPLKDRQTANVFLNISDINAVWAYHVLTETGYFFTGLKPLCSGNEYMVMHNSGEVEIYFEDYVVSREFASLMDYIKRNMTGDKIQ